MPYTFQRNSTPTFAKRITDIKHYVLTFTGVLLAAALRHVLSPVLGDLMPGVFFAIPVIISAFYGGFGPAMFATLLSALLSVYLFIPPYYSFQIGDSARAVTLLIFLGIGFTISFLGKKLKDLQSRTAHQAQQLQEENKRKDDFLAMLAHELRNPLAGISTAAELLKFAHQDEKRLAMTSDIITRQVEHMVKLVDDLLDISRLTRGLVIIDKHPVDINDIVRGAIDQTQSLFDEKAHRLIVQIPSEPACVCGDRTRLVQVVANLLGNAAKYTPEGGQITLTVHVEPDEVELSVQDSGIGLTPELLQRVFEPFVQAERRSDRSQGGLGLGLALVQKITELHDGSVTAYSEGPGQGSTFNLRLPRWKKPAATHKPEPAQKEHPRVKHKGGGRSLTLMVVDDNHDAAHGLATILENQGHTVLVAYNAKQALDMAHTDDLDAFLLDIGLPNVDGYELARRLRLIPHVSTAIFIAVTGYGRQEDKEKSKAAGFHHHFVKPVNTSSLSEVLNRIAATR